MPEVAKPTAATQQPLSFENDAAAAGAIEALIDKQIDARKPKEEKKPEAKTETKEPEAKEEQQPAQQAEEVETEEAQAEEQADKVSLDPDAKVIEVEEVVEGGAKEVRKYSLNELKAQRMMQADYQRKTAELARQREKVVQDSRQAVEAERKRFLQSAQGLRKALYSVASQEFQQEGVDITNQFGLQAYMSKLAKDDPAKYIQMTNRLNELNATINRVNTAVQAETSRTKQGRKEEISKKAKESWEELTRVIPGWNDESYGKLLKAGYEYGFTPEEIANPARADGSFPDGYIPAVDPRFIRLLNDANAYRQQQKEKPLIDKKVSSAPKVIKSGAPAKDDNKQRQEEHMGRLKKTGRIDDAASVIERMMK